MFLWLPYTLGAELVADAGATTVFGAGYYKRRRRYMSYILE